MKKTFKTNNYSMFGSYDFNREVANEANIKAIMEEMQKYGFDEWNPIIVSISGKVADGQHRLEASKRLGVDVWVDQYDREFTPEEVRRMNKNRSNWNTADFIHSMRDDHEACLLYSFIEECRQNGISGNMAQRIAMASNHRDQSTKAVRKYQINEQELKNARNLMRELLKLKTLIPIATKSKFVGAYLRAKTCDNFKLSVFMKKLTQREFHPWSEMIDLIREIEKVYNYKTKDCIEINKEGIRRV